MANRTTKLTKRPAAKRTTKRSVLVTTERRGVFVGKLDSYEEGPRVAHLSDVRMVIRWGTERGLFQLAATGPTANTFASEMAPKIRLEVCECVIDLTPDAEAAWNRLAS